MLYILWPVIYILGMSHRCVVVVMVIVVFIVNCLNVVCMN